MHTAVDELDAELDAAFRRRLAANRMGEQAAGGSALQEPRERLLPVQLESAASYANSCQTLQLDLGEGSGVRTASLAFTK